MLSDCMLTWFVPTAPAALKTLFEAGEPVSAPSGTIVQYETEPYDSLYWVEDGVVGQAVLNHSLNKPAAMNLYLSGTMMGFINLFTGVSSPRRLIVQLPGARLRKIPKADYLDAVRADPALLFETARYAEAAAKSELIGMEALFSLNTEDRLSLFFASAASACGRPAERPGWTALPPLVTRAALCDIVYVSPVTLDRMLARCRRQGVLDRTDSGGWLVHEDLTAPMIRWLKEH